MLTNLSNLMQLKIRGRLIAGFAVVCAVLAIAVGLTTYKVNTVADSTTQIVELRVPTAAASAKMVNNINASLAALRGWMLTGNANFKTGRAAVWADIAKVRADLDRLSATWTNPDNVAKWSEFKVTLDEFQAAQKKVEAIANSVDEQPATKMLTNEAAPRAGVMVKSISKMIDLELAGNSNAGGDRVQLLGMMADVRGTLGLSLANIRAYLLTGNAKFAANFKKLWAKNDRRFADLKNSAHLLSPAQREAFNAFSAKRVEFVPLPAKMFAIRGSKKWNMANYTLVKEAAPRAGKLLTTLAGAKAADGSRSGGMVDNQRALLKHDGEKVEGELSSLITLELILLFVGLAVAAGAAFLAARSIVTPIQSMIGAMNILADGNTNVEIPALDNSDEIGEMARSVQIFKDNKIAADELEAQQVKERAEKEERTRAVEVLIGDFDEEIKGILEVVSAATTEMEATAQSMSRIAEATSEQSSAVASASEQATTNVQTVASAAEELSSSVQEIARQVQESSTIASNAVTETERATIEVRGLAEASQRIGEIVDMINDIASQTNLLALNATIEAARAGDAGKGFAVVASEVKNLATQTAKATEEIGSQIGAIQSATGSAVEVIEGITGTVGQINEITAAISAAVEEQGAATNEISRNVQEAARGTQEVNTNIVKVSDGANETGTASGQVLEATKELGEQSVKLGDQVQDFLEKVRAA